MNSHEGRADRPRPETPNSAGWATFEARVRGRRFARCIERASSSIQLGNVDDAREALNEAKALSPDAPEITELENRIASQPSPGAVLLSSTVPQLEADPGWPRVIGAMAVLVLLFSIFGFGLVQLYFAGPTQWLSLRSADGGPDDLTTGGSGLPASGKALPSSKEDIAPSEKPDLPSEPKSPAASDGRRKPVVPAGPRSPASRPAGRPNRLDAPATRTTPARAASRAVDPVAPAMTAASTPPRPTGTSGPVTAPRLPGAEATRLPGAEATRLPGAEATRLNEGGTPSAAPLDTPVPASHTRSIDESRADEAARIRSVLLRYESAYNRLDANAASSVWPGVDQAALDRAFRGLVSQRVSLGLCDITVIGDIGGASCAGKARWEPRFGGGMQTADRHWTFNLRKTGEDWRIEQIRVR